MIFGLYDVTDKRSPVIEKFILLVKKNNLKELSKKIRYPLNRLYPIPSIKNSSDFIKRYDEFMDSELKSIIITPNKENSWSEMGWRGLMLKNGEIWLDFEGYLTQINYESKFEIKRRAELIDLDKQNLYPVLRNFLEPILEWETKSYHIRVDHLGDYKYRYSEWSKNIPTSQKPDLVINNGEWEADGNVGNHHYDFFNEGTKYMVYINRIGNDDTVFPGGLEVSQSNKIVLDEPAIKVFNE